MLEKTERPIMNGQSRDIGNIDIQDTERRQTQHRICLN
jgi:hypothetical protein